MTNDHGELKPAECPFCGGEPDLCRAVGEWWVRCMACEASTVLTGSPERAISAWNRRASPSPSAWQPIETAPIDADDLLLLSDDVVHHGCWQGASDGAIYSGTPGKFNWFSRTCGQSLHDDGVTHWMPLPPAPDAAPPPEAPSREHGELIDRGTRALFCHREGWPPSRMYSDTVNFWMQSTTPEYAEIIDDLRAQVGAVLQALVLSVVGGGTYSTDIAAAGPSACAATEPHSQSEGGACRLGDHGCVCWTNMTSCDHWNTEGGAS